MEGGKSTAPLPGEDEIDAEPVIASQAPNVLRRPAATKQVIAKHGGAATIGRGQQAVEQVRAPKAQRASKKTVAVPSTRGSLWQSRRLDARGPSAKSQTGFLCFQAEPRVFRKPCRAKDSLPTRRL